MSLLTTKEEILAFYNDDAWWPENNESHVCVDGELILYGDNFGSEVEFFDRALQRLPSAAKIKIDSGRVYDEIGDLSDSLESYFKKWRRTRNIVFFAVECDKAVEDAVREAIKAAGGKIK